MTARGKKSAERRALSAPLTQAPRTKAAGAGILEHIARRYLNVQTLRVQHSDGLDFHDVHVAALRDALDAAFLAGTEAGLRLRRSM